MLNRPSTYWALGSISQQRTLIEVFIWVLCPYVSLIFSPHSLFLLNSKKDTFSERLNFKCWCGWIQINYKHNSIQNCQMFDKLILFFQSLNIPAFKMMTITVTSIDIEDTVEWTTSKEFFNSVAEKLNKINIVSKYLLLCGIYSEDYIVMLWNLAHNHTHIACICSRSK